MPKQLIHMIGGLVTALVLVLGIVTIAAPLLGQSGTTNAEADRIAQTNEIYNTQLTVLRAQEKEFDTLEAALTELRREIPARVNADDVFENVVNSAAATGVTLMSAAADPAEVWLPETGTGAAPAAAPAATDTDPAEATTADTDAAAVAAADTPAPASATTTPERSVPFSMVATAPDANAATAFVDALRSGSRLVRIDKADYVQEEGHVQVTIAAHAYLYPSKTRGGR